MLLKIWSFAIVSLLVMLFSGVVCGEEYSNLLLGGINQVESPCAEPCSSAANSNYKKIAADLNADYFSMYNDGNLFDQIGEVQSAATGEATDQNGLRNEAVHGKTYDTIIAYSGGTATALTVLANNDEYGVTCDTLILVSPMSAGISDDLFTNIRNTVEEDCDGSPNNCLELAQYVIQANAQTSASYQAQVRAILERDPPVVRNIVVITSPQDELMPWVSDIFQVRDFEKYTTERANWYSGVNDINPDITITIQEVPLTQFEENGEEAHEHLFFEYAKTHLSNTNGGVVEFNPEGNPAVVEEEEKPNLAVEALGIGFPLLSPPTSDISGFSDPNKKGSDVPETSGDDLYINKKTDVWYIDAFSWSGDRNLLPRPAAPLKFVSGEYNSYGYNWIYLPYDQTGMTYSQGYLTWVEEYLASIGSPGPSAGVGLLVDEGNGGGGW